MNSIFEFFDSYFLWQPPCTMKTRVNLRNRFKIFYAIQHEPTNRYRYYLAF